MISKQNDTYILYLELSVRNFMYLMEKSERFPLFPITVSFSPKMRTLLRISVWF